MNAGIEPTPTLDHFRKGDPGLFKFRKHFFPILLLVACSQPDPGGVRLIGHGGMGAGAEHPMDSREALLGGLAHGFSGIEMDVQMTADSVLVAYHDATLNSAAPCEGLLNNRTWAELRGCTHSGRSLVRVDSLLFEAQLQHPEAEFTLDVKLFAAGEWWPYLEAFSDALVKLDRSPNLKAPLLFECQTADLLTLLRRKDAEAMIYYYAVEPQAGISTAKELGCTGITIANGLIDADQVQQAHDVGLSVSVFGVDGIWGMRRALAKRPDRIQSDLLPR